MPSSSRIIPSICGCFHSSLRANQFISLNDDSLLFHSEDQFLPQCIEIISYKFIKLIRVCVGGGSLLFHSEDQFLPQCIEIISYKFIKLIRVCVGGGSLLFHSE
eukprot:398179_1